MFGEWRKRARERAMPVLHAQEKLEERGIHLGRDYMTLGLTQNPFNGIGVGISGYADDLHGRTIGYHLLELPAFKLFYIITERGPRIYCGPVADDEKQWRETVAHKQFEHQFGESSEPDFAAEIADEFTYNSPEFELQRKVEEAFSTEFTFHEFAIDITLDGDDATLAVSQIPNEQTAIEIQQLVLRELEEFSFIVRFSLDDDEMEWNVFAQDSLRFE